MRPVPDQPYQAKATVQSLAALREQMLALQALLPGLSDQAGSTFSSPPKTTVAPTPVPLGLRPHRQELRSEG